MPWQVPITVDGLEYPVTFNTEGEPTQQDYDEAVQQILSQKAQVAPEPEPETPGYLSQLGSALGLGYRQMKSGVGATFNALTGDTADVAAEMAEMSKLQREQQAAQTPEDMEFMRSLEEAEKGFEQAQGPLESIGALAQYPAAVFAQPGAAFKTAVQSAPNALISGATSLAGYGLGGLVGGVAGIETGPGAILTGLAGATAGGALSNTLMEAGPSIFDVLNERTQGAASNMTADEITAYLQQNPDIVDEGLKTGAIRGSVIGAVEALGVKGSGRLLTMPERAAARAVQKELMAQGVDVASKEAVDKALLDPALRASTKAAADTAKNQFSSAGNMARLAGASAIETGAAGAGELAAQAAAGQDISTKEAFLEMMGDAALSLPMAATTKVLEGAKYMLNPELVSDLGKASAENLAATGSTAAAEAQEGFNEAIELTMLPFTREDIRATEMPFTREDIRATDLPFTREDIRATQLPFGREDIRATEMPFSRKDIRGISTPAPAVEEEPQTPSPEMEMPLPPKGVNMASAPVSPIITEAPLSEGAERVVTSEEESLAAKRRADLLSAAADVAKGRTKAQVSPAVTAMVTPQPVETQENAVQEQIPDEGVLRQERPEMELQGVGEGNIQPEEVAATSQAGEEVATSLPSGRHRFSKSKLSKLPKQVVDALMQRKTSLDNSFNFTSSPSIDIDEDSYYTLVNPATGESRRLTTPGEFAGTATGKNVVKPTANIPLPKGAFVVYQKKTPGGGMSLGVVEGSFEAPKKAITPSAEPTTATEGKVTPGVVATERDLTKPEQMTPEEALRVLEERIGPNNPKHPDYSRPDWREIEARVKNGEDLNAVLIDSAEGYLKIEQERDDAEVAAIEATRSSPDKEYVRQQAKMNPDQFDSEVTLPEFKRRNIGKKIAKDTEILKRLKAMRGEGDYFHRKSIEEAAAASLPVSAAAVDAYGIKLPEGYVKQGELYIFQPQTKQAAEKQTPVPLREGTGAAGVVQSEPVEGSIPTDEKVSPETESASSGKLDPKLIEAEQKQAKADKAAEKKRKKREEMRSKAIDSIIGAAEKKKRKFGQVTNSDAIAAVAMLVSSKDIPGVLTTWWGTKEDFLRDPANQTADPEIYARIKAGELVEGFFNKGRAYIFLDGIGVSDEDMLRGEQMDVSPQIAAVRRVLLHESLVHRGIHGLPLRHRRKILNWVKENSTPAELDELANLYTEYANWRNSEYEFEALAEELLAKKVDSLTEIPKDGPMAKLMDILRQIWDFIVGYKREPTLSDLKSVVKLLKSGAEALANDALKDGSQVKLSYAGEKAIENLPEERRQFMRDSLDTAKAMAAAGKDSEEIRAVTGWFPGKYDGKMRWEVPDDGASLLEEKVVDVPPPETQRGYFRGGVFYPDANGDLYTVITDGEADIINSGSSKEEAENRWYEAYAPNKKRKVGGTNSGKLFEVLNHPALFDAYPILKEVEVEFRPLSDRLGDWTVEKNLIRINSGIRKDKALSTLLHEAQHAIQSIEGFAKGSSVSQFSDYTGEAQKRFDRFRDILDSLGDAVILKYNLRNGSANLGEAKEQFRKEFGREPHPEAGQHAKFLTDEEIGREAELAQERLEQAKKTIRRGDAFNQYQLTAGEIEARDVQARQKLTPEQRAATAPYSSENITPEDVIVLFGGGPQASVQFPSDTSAAFTAGSEATRSTLYSERDMDIREAIRRAYEAMPKQNSVAVPIGELFAKTEELMSGVTQDEFSNVLQDLFEDNGAVLQEGEQITPEQEAEIQSFEKDNPFNELIRKSPQKSPSLGEINGVSKKFVQRVLRPTSSFAANNGIRIDDNAPLQARAMPDGGIVIGYSIPQERFDELQKMAPQAASQYTKDSVIEELIHVSDLIGLRNQWIKSGKRLSFDQFVLGEQSKLAFSLIQKAESLNDTEAESLRRILASSLSLYNNNPEIANLGLNELLELAAQYPYVLPELVRSLIQLKKTGQLTETAFRKIANLLRKWQEIVLQWISDGYASAKEGVFGEMISERIKNAENNLAQLSDAAEINVTTPEGRRAGFVVVMPRAAKASRIKAEDASDAAKTFQADIIEAGKGRIDTDSYQGNTLKSTEAPDHNVNAPELYKDAAISLVDSLLKNHSITEIADSFQDPEFRVAVGLLGNKAINPNVAQQAELFTGAEIQNRLENSLNKERNPAKKRIIEKTLKNHKAYYTTATGIGQNLNAVGALQQDPRFKWMFMFNEAEKEMADKAKEKLDIITGGGTQPVTDTVNQSEEAAADEATKEMTSDAEEDQDAIDLAAGEETLDERLKRLYEELKDWLRTKGAIVRARAARKSANAAKASLSKEQRDAIMQMSDEELDALEKKADENIERILNTILGKESEAKTPEQKKTRAKRKKMVDTAKKRAEAGKEISPEAKEAAAIEMAENKASQIVYRFEELYRQGFKNPPEGMSKKEQKDSIIKAFRDQVKNPTSFEAFAERLANLKVGAEVAERMFLTASRERADLIRVKDFKIAKRKVEIADKQASRLIYATEERFRQGSKDLNESKDGDSINKAFRDQVSTPVSESDFSKRLAKLNVSPDVATRLFKTAAREKADLEAMEAFKLIEGPDALKRMLAEINKARPGQEAPFSKQIPWREILSQRAKTVEEYRQRIFDAISSNEAFQNLPDDKKAKLADLFSEAWESKRKDILDRMLEREIERKRREGSLSEAAAKALQKSRNKIIELANLGGFDNDDLMKVLGEKFGIKTGFSEAEKARISELADKLQDETLNPAKRNKLAMEFAVTLAGASEIPVAEIIANWWTSSVLFGPQTIFSIGAAFVNGAYSITTIGTRRMLADLTRGDVKGAIEESILMLQGIAKYLGAFKQAGRRAWSYLWTGNVDVLGAAANDILGEINSLEELKRFKRHKLLAENLAKDPRALRRYVGMYLRFVNRLLTSLDAFNVMVTKAGTASLALRMSGMSTDNIIKAEKMLNLKSYKDQVIRDYFDNKAPTTQAEKALVDSYAEAAMYRAVDQLGGKMENADYLASESAMTMNPTGLGGFFYRSITGLDSKMKKAAEDYLEKAKKDWTTEKDLESTLFLGLAYLRQFAVQNLGGVAGYKFIRFASNKFNQGISYLPMVGLLRTLEAKGDDIKGKEAFIETIHRNQVIGAVLTLAALAVVKALEEEPDDEERGNFWNGGWQNLTPDQKKQMLAKGQKEYTMGFKFNGRWYVFNYQNWPLNQILAAIGSMSDQIRFSPKQWEEKGPLSKSLAGIVSGLKSTLEIPALSQLGELAGNRLASKDPTEQTVDRLSRVASGWVGGFVPRILKDLDFATQPELRKYKTLWEKTASHIPIYRRYVGEDYYDILGQPIKRNVIPGSREFMMGPTEPEYKILGALNSRNIFLTPANAEYRMVGKGRNRRRLTQEEADAYSLETGKGYRQMLLRYGQRALQMPTERARAFLSDKADEVRDRALKKVYRR